jgi:putative addiction module component (TIGR02574 family)
MIQLNGVFMSLTVEQITQEALALPLDARVSLTDRLIESLRSTDENKAIEQLWATEACRRRDEIRNGRVQTIPGDEALKQVRRALAQ